jgi:hypothetical protein
MTKTRRTNKRSRSHSVLKRLWLVGIFVAAALVYPTLNVKAATLSTASVAISDPRPNATASYTFTGSNVTTSIIRCLRFEWRDTATGSTVPASLSTAGATLDTNVANTNYIPTPGSWTLNKPANGTLTLTNAAGETPASAAARKVTFNSIVNGATADTRYWLKVFTYTNVDCSTGQLDNATVLFIYTNGSTLTLTVDQTLSFTVNAVGASQACNGTTTTQASTSTTIPFGTVSSASNGVVCQDLTAATNATNGYTVYARYTAAPTNALSQTIANHTGSNAAPAAFSAAGVEAYGYTTDDATLAGVNPTANRFTSPAQGWAAMTTTNAEVAYSAVGVTTATHRVGHQVGVSTTTEPGTYSTTVIYTLTPVY